MSTYKAKCNSFFNAIYDSCWICVMCGYVYQVFIEICGCLCCIVDSFSIFLTGFEGLGKHLSGIIWCQTLYHSYFLHSTAFGATDHTLYIKILNSLKDLEEYGHFNQNLRKLLQKAWNYFKYTKLYFLLCYRELEREKRESNAKQTLNQKLMLLAMK